MKYEKLVTEVIELVGGEGNVEKVTHCVTRLRFQLKDENLAQTEQIKKVKGVLSVVSAGGQYQIIIGQHVIQVYKELMQLTNIQGTSEETSGKDDSSEKKTRLFDRLIETVSSIMLPVVPVLAGSGMIMGITALLMGLGIIENNGSTHLLLRVTGEGLLVFFPIFLGYTSMKRFGGNPFVGMAIGAALTHPFVVNELGVMENPTFFGMPLLIPSEGYLNQVFPVMLATYFASILERFFARISPNSIRSFFVPMSTMLLVIPITFLMIGPVIVLVSDLIGDMALFMFEFNAILWGMLMGATWLILVMFGLHWGILPIAIAYVIQHGYSPILGGTVGTAMALGGSTLAVWIKTKDESLKARCVPAFLSAILSGTTEPALYSVAIPLKRPFIMTTIASMISGGVAGALGMVSHRVVPGGIFLFTGYIHPEYGFARSFWASVIAVIVALVLGFGLTWIAGWNEPIEAK